MIDTLRDVYGRTAGEMLDAMRHAGWTPEATTAFVECSDGACPDWQLSVGEQPLFWHHSHVTKSIDD